MCAANGERISPNFSSSTLSCLGKELMDLGEKIMKVKDLSKYDQLAEENQRLEGKLRSTIKELKGAKDDIEDLEAEKETLKDEFGKRYTEWNSSINKEEELKKQIDNLQTKLKKANNEAESDRNMAIKLQKQLNSNKKATDGLKNSLEETKGELKSKDLELNGAKQALKFCESELEKQKGELGIENLRLQDLAADFSTLAVKCHELAKKFFYTELQEYPISDEYWKRLCDSGFVGATLRKTPWSNSIPAQCIRMATAENIIAHKLSSNIFKQYYLPALASERKTIDDVLKKLDQPHKEAIFRVQLLAAYEAQEQDYIRTLVEATLDEISKPLNLLLFTPASRENFRSALKEFLSEALKLWRTVQRSAIKGQVRNKPEHSIFNDSEDPFWGQNEDYNDSSVEVPDDQIPPQEEPVMSLFPQVLLGSNVVYNGCALWSDQKVVVAANIEFIQGRGKVPSVYQAMGG
ncbi:hypothetical protein B7463_g11586, partial [Scytalidium lignicola]